MIGIATLALAPIVAGAPTQVELTIYNQGFALVKEVRQADLRQGVQQLAIEDVAALIEANSVGIRSLSAPGSFSVWEQNYQYDLISPWAILNKAVGHKIVFNRILPNGVKERVVGVLLSAPSAVVSDANGNPMNTYNGMVIRTDDGRILLNPTGEIEVSSIPEGLISKPTLLWELEAEKAGKQTVELSYLTQGMSWKADYVFSLNESGNLGDMKGWVTLTNNAGATFNDVKLKLLAGDVQRVREAFGRAGGFGGADAMAMKAAPGFQEEQFADYHLYTLQRPATVRNKEIKQVSLLEAIGVPVRKRLIVDATRMFGYYRPSEGEVGTGPIKPMIVVEFTNDKASKMGMPLPMGNVKVYQRDSSGSVQMLGEDHIEHTPRDEKVSLTIGRAFDIVAERKRTSFEWIRRDNGDIRGAREKFEIELRNRKDTTETVDVYERAWGEWAVTEKNVPFEKMDANTFVFKVELKPQETRKVTYTLETRW